MDECVATGGHNWVNQGGGILVGIGATHHRSCDRCPAIQEGFVPYPSPSDAEIRWSEPYHRDEVPARHRQLTGPELREMADSLAACDQTAHHRAEGTVGGRGRGFRRSGGKDNGGQMVAGMTDNSKRHAELLDWFTNAGCGDLQNTLRDILNLHAPSAMAPQFCAECDGVSSPVGWPCRTVQPISQRADDDPWWFRDDGDSRFGVDRPRVHAVFEGGPVGLSLWIVEGMSWPTDYQWVVFDEPTRHLHKCVWNHVGGGHYRLAEVEDLGPVTPGEASAS